MRYDHEVIIVAYIIILDLWLFITLTQMIRKAKIHFHYCIAMVINQDV